MIINYNNYLNCELPDNWCFEEWDEGLNIYNPEGEGALTLSFFNILALERTVTEQISIMAKKFFDQNNIASNGSFVVCPSKENTTVLYGIGTTSDNWFVKLWIVSKGPKIVLASYISPQKSKEVKMCDKIIEKMSFTF